MRASFVRTRTLSAIILSLLLIAALQVSGQAITGKWISVDDNTNEEKAVIEIFENKQRIFGKIIKIFQEAGGDPDPVCEECSQDDDRYRKKIIGMEIIRDMKKQGNEYVDGNILDPENGRVYKCKLWLEGTELKVRGYWGPFYRTQTWKRSAR